MNFLSRLRRDQKKDPVSQQVIQSAYRSVLGREPDNREIASSSRMLRGKRCDLESLFHQLLDSREYELSVSGVSSGSFWLSPGNSGKKADRLQGGPLDIQDFRSLLGRVLPAPDNLIIGQEEYLRTHDRRFLELANAVLLLASERGGLLEFGVSEFSRVYRDLRPNCRLITSDRPLSEDAPGFTPERCRRISGCDAHVALDLEDDSASEWSVLAELGPFELILFSEVLEHLLAEPAALLQRLLGLLSGRGVLYLSTPNFFRSDNRVAWTEYNNPQPMYPGRGENWDAHHHFREYSMTELVRLVHYAGGRVLTCYFSDYWGGSTDRFTEGDKDLRSGMVLLATRR